MTPPSRIADEGRKLVTKLGGRWSGFGGLCRCPAHADRTPSLSVRVGRSRLLFHCFAGCAPRAVIAALAAAGHIEPAPPASQVAASRDVTPSLNEAALRLWRASRPIPGTMAERYLASRGLACTGDTLRFHPSAPFGRYPTTVFVPALIAAVHDDCGLIAVHRTRLDHPVACGRSLAPRKAALGRLGSGAARLTPAAPVLGLAEGIEDALSVTVLTGIGCWATLGSARFGRIALPSGTRDLVLFLDADEAGRRAARVAREAYGDHVTVHARFPVQHGWDWNDVLVAQLEARARQERRGSA